MTDRQNYQPSNALGRLMAGVALMATKHTRTDWSAVALNLPLFVVTYGLVAISTEDRSALAAAAMPDTWICAAAELPAASAKNLARLRQAIEKRGFVSIEDADRFCTVELAREQEAACQRTRAAAVEQGRAGLGYAALSLRLAADDGDLTPEQAYAKLRTSVRGLADAGVGLLSLAADKAAWLGKGVSVAVDRLRAGG
jgi:hypothetical protein